MPGACAPKVALRFPENIIRSHPAVWSWIKNLFKALILANRVYCQRSTQKLKHCKEYRILHTCCTPPISGQLELCCTFQELWPVLSKFLRHFPPRSLRRIRPSDQASSLTCLFFRYKRSIPNYLE